MQCIHCGSSAGHSRDNELRTSEWNRLTKRLSEMNCKEITILGGEPFLHPDWFEIAQTIKDYGMRIIIVSNGLIINDAIISQLQKIEPYAIAISIDGGTPETHDTIRQRSGSFQFCMKALQHLQSTNLPSSVITTVNKKNLSELSLLRSHLLNKGCAWQLQLATPLGRFPKELALTQEEFYAAALFIATTRKIYSIKELPIIGAHCFGYNSRFLPNINLLPIWKGCQAGLSVLGVQSDGGVKGCLSLPKKFIEGNIRKNDIFDIWNNPNNFVYNRNFDATTDLNGDCINCRFGKKCKGGCLSVSTALTGKNHGDPYCLSCIEKNFIK